MKIIDKMILCVFSVIMLIISIFSSFFIFGWLNVGDAYIIIKKILEDNVICNVILCLNLVFIIFAIKAIFFESKNTEEKNLTKGILLENNDGKLLITKETIKSIVQTVISGFASVKSQESRIILDEESNVSILVTIEVDENAIIKELSNNIQIKVKETIKKSLDIDIKSLDIRIKNIVTPKKLEE